MRLFAVELKRALLPLAIVSLSGTVIVLLIERILVMRGQLPTTVAGAVDLFVLFGLLLMGYVGGERAFSREFKERDLPCVDTLPVPRWRIWLSVVAANYLALVTCTVGVVGLRPQLLLWNEVAIAAVLVLQASLFAVSCSFSLIFLRPAGTYAVGLLVSGLTFVEATGRRATDLLTLDLETGGVGAVTRLFEQGAIVFLVLISFFLAHSLWSFTRGELLLTRSRLKSAGALLVTVVCIVTVTRSIGVGLDSRSEYSLAASNFRGFRSAFVQPGGERLCVLEWRGPRPYRARIEMLDAESGARIGRLQRRALRPVGWTDDGREFLALARESRFLVSLDLLFPRSLSLVSIDHRGRTRERLDLGRRRFVSVESLDQPDLYLLITEADGVGSLLVLDAGRVNVTEVAAGPADSYPDVRFTPEGLLVRFGDATGLLSAWLVGDDPYDPVPIPVARESTRSLPDVILDGALHSRTGESASALLDQLSQPVHANADEGGPARGIYMIPSLVRDDTPIFYVETKLEERYAELFLRRPVDERWTRVATRIPARSQYFDTIRGIPDKNMIATHALGNLDGLAITQLGEIAVFVSEQEGLYQVGLHDARRGRQLELAQLIRTEPNRIPEVRLRRIPDIDGWLVGLRYGETHTFRYDPASGELEEISEFSRSIELTQDPAAGGRGARLAWFYSWPSLRYRDARGVEIHEVDGKLIRLTPDGHREVLYGD